MEKTECVNVEAKFDSDELFFSITDRSSTILSGNEVFTRISGYAEEELVGSYHNIIRHPDMPRIVFKTLWDALNAEKPLVAYVKNRSREGKYYWVLAAVFPLGERYVSIRIKPASSLFAAVRDLYERLLGAEARGGMEASAELLETVLGELGYDGYEPFMHDALFAELRQRKSLSGKSCLENIAFDAVSPSRMHLKALHDTSAQLVREYDTWYEKAERFGEVKTVFQEKGALLRLLARDVVFLSLNASVASYKIESGGETFGVLSRDIRTSAKENDELIGTIHGTIQKLSQGLSELIFSISAITLQIETVRYFIEEALCQNREEKLAQIHSNIADLIALVSHYSQHSHTLPEVLLHDILDAVKHLDQIEKQLSYLGYIQVYGVIEAARENEEGARFGVIFSELKTLLGQTSREVESLQKLGRDFEKESRNLMEKSVVVETIVQRLQHEATSTKGMDSGYAKPNRM